jgi:thiamine biosynthesis protein ThiS
MNIIVNGERREAVRAGNVAELVAELGLVPETLLVEHNGTALRREEWAASTLADGDRIEFIRIVAGG